MSTWLPPRCACRHSEPVHEGVPAATMHFFARFRACLCRSGLRPAAAGMWRAPAAALLVAISGLNCRRGDIALRATSGALRAASGGRSPAQIRPGPGAFTTVVYSTVTHTSWHMFSERGPAESASDLSVFRRCLMGGSLRGSDGGICLQGRWKGRTQQEPQSPP